MKTRLITAVSLAIVCSGCANLHTYTASKPADGNTTLVFKQGVGTLASSEPEGDIVIYPTFRLLNSGAIPTFSIYYMNKTDKPVDFSNANVKVFWRGAQVGLYTFEERTAEIRSNKMKAQILMAVVGGVAAASAAHSASHQTTTYNAYGRNGWIGGGQINTYNPAAGMLAAGTVGAATGVSINQIERYAANDEVRAQALLQQNTVLPQANVDAQLMVKNCCDDNVTANDEMRFEVTVGGKTKTFAFNRNTIKQ